MANDEQQATELMERLDAWAAEERHPSEERATDALTNKQRSQLWHLCSQSSRGTLSYPLIR